MPTFPPLSCDQGLTTSGLKCLLSVGVLSSNIFHPGPGPLESADPTALAGPTRSKHGREGIDWPRNLSGRSRLLSTVGASAAELQPPYGRCSGTQGVLDSALPTVGGSGLSQHLGKTPAPHARVTLPLLEGHTRPWRLSSVGRLPVQLSGWSLLGTVLYSGERCLGAGLHEDGGGPQAGHRGPEGSDSPEGAPCDDLLGIA